MAVHQVTVPIGATLITNVDKTQGAYKEMQDKIDQVENTVNSRYTNQDIDGKLATKQDTLTWPIQPTNDFLYYAGANHMPSAKYYNQDGLVIFTQNTANNGTNINLDPSLQPTKWKVVGTKNNARTWNYNILPEKKYRITYNWGNSNSDIEMQKIITTPTTFSNTPLETFLESVSAVTVVGISVIGVINSCQLNLTTTGITITNKTGTTTSGNILKLEEAI